MKTTKPIIWICPDKYRGTLSAMEASTIIAEGLAACADGYDLRLAPMADGGEGTAALLGRLHGATSRRVVATVNPLGHAIEAQWWLNQVSGEGFIDSASVIGHETVNGQLAPWHSSSLGLGVAIRKILDSDPRVKLNVCLGGTVTVDGGAGLLQGLGWQLLDRALKVIPSPILPSQLRDVVAVEAPSDAEMVGQRIHAISDVEGPLWSREGISSLSFAPQKGVKANEINDLTNQLRHWETVLGKCRERLDISGAGGGTGYALQWVVGSDTSLGAEEMIKAYGIFREVVPGMMVITGEGCLDAQSVAGKVVGSLLRHCMASGVEIAILPGTSTYAIPEREGVVVISTDQFLPDLPLNPDVARKRLFRAAKQVKPLR